MREKLIKLFGSHLINLDMLPDDAVIIDAGACVGNFIKDIEKHVKNPYVFAVEPNRENVKKLREEFNHPIIIEAALVGEKEKEEMLFSEIKNLPEWGNVTGLYHNRGHTSYTVKTVNLKELLYIIPIKEIHYMKMDIEGSESDVVSDMNEETAERIEQISMEIHGNQIKITKKMEDLGYKTFFDNGELYAVRKEL